MEKAGEYRKFYGLVVVVETFAIISEVVTSPSLLSTKVNLYLPDQLGDFHPTRAADEHEWFNTEINWEGCSEISALASYSISSTQWS